MPMTNKWVGNKPKKGTKEEITNFHITFIPHFPKPFSTFLIFLSHLQSFETFLFLTLSYRDKVGSRPTVPGTSRWEKTRDPPVLKFSLTAKCHWEGPGILI